MAKTIRVMRNRSVIGKKFRVVIGLMHYSTMTGIEKYRVETVLSEHDTKAEANDRAKGYATSYRMKMFVKPDICEEG